ncbi:hypothetical protein ACHAPX_004576 [Trichoderma viride]
MAEPIRNKRSEYTAPTPQNTPAATAPITSRAQQPGVASIKEGKSNPDNGCKSCVSNLVSVL